MNNYDWNYISRDSLKDNVNVKSIIGLIGLIAYYSEEIVFQDR